MHAASHIQHEKIAASFPISTHAYGSLPVVMVLGCRLEQLLRFFRALQTSRVSSITRNMHAKHEPILK